MLLDDKALLPDELDSLSLSSLSTFVASCFHSTSIAAYAERSSMPFLTAQRIPSAVDELVLVLETTVEVNAIFVVVLLEPAFEW